MRETVFVLWSNSEIVRGKVWYGGLGGEGEGYGLNKSAGTWKRALKTHLVKLRRYLNSDFLYSFTGLINHTVFTKPPSFAVLCFGLLTLCWVWGRCWFILVFSSLL